MGPNYAPHLLAYTKIVKIHGWMYTDVFILTIRPSGLASCRFKCSMTENQQLAAGAVATAAGAPGVMRCRMAEVRQAVARRTLRHHGSQERAIRSAHATAAAGEDRPECFTRGWLLAVFGDPWARMTVMAEVSRPAPWAG